MIGHLIDEHDGDEYDGAGIICTECFDVLGVENGARTFATERGVWCVIHTPPDLARMLDWRQFLAWNHWNPLLLPTEWDLLEWETYTQPLVSAIDPRPFSMAMLREVEKRVLNHKPLPPVYEEWELRSR